MAVSESEFAQSKYQQVVISNLRNNDALACNSWPVSHARSTWSTHVFAALGQLPVRNDSYLWSRPYWQLFWKPSIDSDYSGIKINCFDAPKSCGNFVVSHTLAVHTTISNFWQLLWNFNLFHAILGVEIVKATGEVKKNFHGFQDTS